MEIIFRIKWRESVLEKSFSLAHLCVQTKPNEGAKMLGYYQNHMSTFKTGTGLQAVPDDCYQLIPTPFCSQASRLQLALAGIRHTPLQQQPFLSDQSAVESLWQNSLNVYRQVHALLTDAKLFQSSRRRKPRQDWNKNIMGYRMYAGSGWRYLEKLEHKGNTVELDSGHRGRRAQLHRIECHNFECPRFQCQVINLAISRTRSYKFGHRKT